MYARANAMGEEFRGKGVHVLLGPSVGPLGRSPAGGRNWEGFGSDPYLQGVAAYQSVKVCLSFFFVCEGVMIMLTGNCVGASRVFRIRGCRRRLSILLPMNRNILEEMVR